MGTFTTTNTREIIDCETGEIKTIETQKTFITRNSNNKSFYITFVDFVSTLYGLKPDKAKDLLVWMCCHAEFNTGKVELSTATRQDISKELNISNNAITNYLKVLKDKNLISGSKGKFIINPEIFWKGDLKEREKLLKSENIQVIFSIGQ